MSNRSEITRPRTGKRSARNLFSMKNLTLLTLKINEKIANKSFQKKQELAFKKSKLKLNDSLKRVKKWGDQEIEKRQKDMAKIALQVWKL